MAAITVIPSHTDFSDYDAAQAKLTAAFDQVMTLEDWRGPIHAVVGEDADLPLIAEAVIHFTATVPSFTRVTMPGGATYVRVEADGYRAGPAGP